MDFFQVAILSVVEGITEFLPVSSTGHLIIVSRLLKIPPTDFLKTFEIVIQLGAILAIMLLYAKPILQDRQLLKKVFVAFVPTGIIGFFLYKLVKTFLLSSPIVVAFTLILGGILLIVFEFYFRRKKATITLNELSYPQAALIGIFQSISVIPGASRAACTILGGLFLGLDRKSAVEFSFLLALPTMLAASSYDFLKSGSGFSANQFGAIIIGIIMSFIVALVVVKWFLKYIQNHSFIPFGVYRIVIGIIFFLSFIR